MLPVIALVGRPNVGKSTLFNRLTRSRDALVADSPGLTRDRQYGEGRLGDKPYIVVDTGGIGENEVNIDEPMSAQSRQAINEADIVFFLVDARAGVTAADEVITQQLRQREKNVVLVVNKTDGIDVDSAMAEFYGLGLGEPQAIAAAHGRGVTHLITTVLDELPEIASEPEQVASGIKLAIVGRPNVGKSTLVNRMLGEERVVVFDMPGTTRDSIFIPLERRGQQYTLIDTAGVRRRGKVHEVIEKFSVIKTLQAIEDANVVLLLLDAQEGITEQDLHLLGFVLDAGKALVVAINKWDGLEPEQKQFVQKELDRRLQFVDYAEQHYISALHGSGVGDLFKSVNKAYQAATKKLLTPQLTNILEQAVTAHQPPLVHGRRIKLRYAHAGGQNPPIIVIHGNQTESLPNAYKRYLMNTFRKALHLKGTPIRLELKSSDNPYKGRKNKLTPRQIKKRQRMLSHYKKKK